MATIKDIAKMCNVSVATVSNVLNNKGGASDETRERVRKVAEEFHFTPNIIAKNLKQRSTRTIGVITEDLTVFNTPEIVDGIDYYYESRNYHMLLSNLRLFKEYGDEFYESSKFNFRIADEMKVLLAKQVEGIIYVGCHARNISCFPRDFPIPILVAYSYVNDGIIPSVTFDDEQGAYDATMELIQNGHRSIGAIGGYFQSLHTQQRLMGYQRALYSSGILFNPSLVAFGEWTRESGYHIAKSLLKQNVTAIVAMNDLIAGGIMDCAKELGITVGKDLSIIGFDNRDISTAYNPALSTMQLPLFEIGQKSAELILDIISHKTPMENQTYKIGCSLIRRDSVSPLSER